MTNDQWRPPTPVVPAPPDDPALPTLARALQSGDAHEAMQDWLAPSGPAVDACRPTYIRYKPETKATIRYDLDLSDGDRHWRHIVVARVLPPGASTRQIAKPWIPPVAAAYQRLANVPPIVNPAAELPALAAIVTAFPIDEKLPGIIAWFDPDKGAGCGRSLPAGSVPTVVRYKPGRRALLRSARSGREGQHTIYARIVQPELAASLAERSRLVARALRTHGIRASAPRMIAPGSGALINAEEPGVPLVQLRNSPAYLDHMPAVIEAVRILRATSLPLPTHRLADELAALHATARTLGGLVPDLRTEVNALVANLDAVLGTLPDDLCPAHGDFYDDQLLVHPDGFTLLDLDEVRVAHPALDPGNFLAHLDAAMERSSPEVDTAVLAAARDALIDAWETECGSTALAAARAAGVLKLAVEPFRRLEPDWPDRIAALVTRASLALPRQRASGSRQPDLPLSDPKLQNLPAALDGALIARNTRLPVGRPELVKHKPGRRAVVRYPVAMPARNPPAVFIKVYAHERGLRTARRTEAIGIATAGRLTVPRVLHVDRVQRLIVLEGIAGLPLNRLLETGDIDAAARAGAGIAALHHSDAALDARHTALDEIRATARQLAALHQFDPVLNEAARTSFTAASDLLTALAPWRYLPAHRDCYPAQILLTKETVGIVDLDDACRTEPAVDVGNVLAHLDLEALLRPDLSHVFREAATAFLAGYRSNLGVVSDHQVATLRAVSLIRLVGVHAPHEGSVLGHALLATARQQMRLAVNDRRIGQCDGIAQSRR